MKKSYAQLARPLIVLFVLVNALAIVFQRKLEAKQVSVDVVITANLILFAIGMLNIYLQAKNLQNPNPRAIVRGMMVGTLFKLLVVAGAVLAYLVVTGPNRNRPGVLVGMGLYVIYTVLEVKISLRLNPKK